MTLREASLVTAVLCAGPLTAGFAHASGESVPISPFSLPPGATVTMTFDVDVASPLVPCAVAIANQGRVTGTGISVPTDDTAAGGASDPTLTPLDVVDLAITNSDGGATGTPGSPVTYTIVVTNTGPAAATGATVTDTFPATLSGVSWTCVGAGGATCAAGGAGSISDLVSLPVGGTVTYTATGTISAAATGTLVNTAAVTRSATQVECDLADNSATDTDTLTPQADLAVVATESVDPAVAGSGIGNLSHTITVTNAGPSTATAVTVSENLTLPAGFTLVSVTPSQGTFTSPDWALGTLAPAASATLTVVMTATAATAAGADVACSTASVTGAAETLVNTGNDGDTECTSVSVTADLSIAVLDDAEPLPGGSNLTYTIAVTNNGPANATGVVVADPLPAAVTYVSDTCGASDVPPWTWNVGSMASGATVSCDLVVSVRPSPPASISNTATVAAVTADPVPGNNSATQATTLDDVPPTVVALDTLPATPGGLAPGSRVNEPVTHILVTFSEAMNDAAGDSGTDDVTNPANYRLVEAGPDGTLQTISCSATPAGDDRFRPLAGVAWDNGRFLATVDLGGALPFGSYRFLACGSTTLRDLAGNPLEGGSDFARDFRRENPSEIPTLGSWGTAGFALLLTVVAWSRLQRRSRVGALLALALLVAATPAAAQTTIDTFTTNQAALSDPPGGSSSVTGGTDVVGARRGIVVDTLFGAGPTTVAVSGGGLTLTVNATTPDSRGEARLSWDGDSDPATLSPTGLGGVDLTVGNVSGFRFRFAATTAPAELEMTVYTSAADSSSAARLVPVSGSDQDVLLPFAEFRVAGGSGASFASVGAITLTVRTAEGTVRCDEIVTTPPAVAATKVDALVVDGDGDGRVDPGDRVRYTVTIANTGNQALDVDLADVIDGNTTLVAGSVRSTPVAHNDQYAAFADVPLVVDGTPLPTLLDNDSDPDGGPLTVQAGSLPPTSTRGGTVAPVDAATGAFTYGPPAGFTGVDSFIYTVVDGDANTATAVAFIDVRPNAIAIRATVSPAADTAKVGDLHTFTVAAEVTRDGSTWTAAPAGTVLGFTFTGTVQAVTDPGPDATSCTLVAGGICSVTVTFSSPGTGTLTVTSASSLVVDGIQAVPSGSTIPVGDADPTAGDSRVGTVTWIRYVANVQASDTNLLSDPHTFTITAAAENGATLVALAGGVAQFTWSGAAVSSGASVVSPGLYACNLPCSITVNSTVPFTGTITLTQVTSTFNGGTVTLTATPGTQLVTTPGGTFTQTKTWIRYVADVQAPDTGALGIAHTFTITAGAEDGTGTLALTGGVARFTWDGAAPTSGATAVSPGLYACNLPCSITVNSNVTFSGTITLTEVSSSFTGGTVTLTAPPGPQLVTPPGGSFTSTMTWVRYVANVQPSGTSPVGDPHTFTIVAGAESGAVIDALTGGVAWFSWDGAAPTSGATAVSPGLYSCNLPCSITVNSDVPFTGTITLTQVSSTFNGGTVTVTATPGPQLVTPPGGSFTQTKTWL